MLSDAPTTTLNMDCDNIWSESNLRKLMDLEITLEVTPLIKWCFNIIFQISIMMIAVLPKGFYKQT